MVRRRSGRLRKKVRATLRTNGMRGNASIKAFMFMLLRHPPLPSVVGRVVAIGVRVRYHSGVHLGHRRLRN
jgi:hypothetical protein